MSAPAAPESAAGSVCSFWTKGDYVHISSSAFEASGRGWWVDVDCGVPTARVTVQLQEYYSDGTWRNKGVKGDGVVKSGGGSGNRVTGRSTCNNGTMVTWRSEIDVDVIGVADPPDKLHTTPQTIGCLAL